jgi:class 3 adenylate cyclase/tetratricopeptide (TPR) repeat protein
MPEERRLVTVLFADVTGSTALGEELDPEDVRALLSRYYAIAREVVAEHGGTLEKFIGDAVMAVFGLPQAHGDDATRAIAAAVALRDQVRDDPALGERLPIRLGVNTGEVVATAGATGDFLITGDAVNTAARIQQLAEPWVVLCGRRTARAAAADFAFGPELSLAAKGKRDAIRALPVIAATPGSARTVPRMPLFGRGGDLAQLELVARRVADERRPFLVSIIAPAGTGKTRLLEEFLDRLDGTLGPATVAVAQCLPYGQRLTYWPLRAVLLRLVGAPDDADAATVRDAIGSWAAAAGIERAEEMARLLATTIGVGEGTSDRSALLGAWRDAVEHAARQRPLVLVFEDLHWSSDSLLDLVEFVMQPHAGVPVLVVALTRPELLDRRPGWGGGRRNYVALSLEPLRDDAVAEIAGHLLETSDPAIIAKVVERAEGNPFFAGELVRSLVERVGPGADDAATLQALASLPDTVQATVLARLDLLQPIERRILQLGAVYGRAFRSGGIVALDPDLASSAAAAIDALVDKDLVRPTAADGYAFRHILIREVAYQTLTRSERVALHAAAAGWLERAAAGREDALVELIAYHWREAASLSRSAAGPADEAIRRKAVTALVRAAETAGAGAATVEATRHLRAAIELAPTEELPELHLRIGDVFLDATTSAAAFRRALELATEQASGPEVELRAIAGLLQMVTRFQGNVADRPSHEEIEALRARGRALFDRVADERLRGHFLVAETFVPFWMIAAGLAISDADLGAAGESARAAEVIAERIDDVPLWSAALDGQGSVAQMRGDHAEARRVARYRIARLEDRLPLGERLDAYSVIAWSSCALGDLKESRETTRRALAIVQPGQAPSTTLHAMAWRAYALMLLGDWDELAGLAERMIQIWEDVGRHPAGYILRGFLAARDVAVARGNDHLRERTMSVMREIAAPFLARRGGVRNEWDVAIDGEDAAERLEVFTNGAKITRADSIERILAAASDADHRLPVGPLQRLVVDHEAFEPLAAQAVRALGLARDDASLLADARARFERMGARPYVARLQCEHGRLAGDQHEIAAGLAMLRALGDQPQLARFEGR